eukprot:TRINITY_DN75611_c0_g1_i1.p1 TRINITY_DN75611_c0_g1~~TRINITY_DN75611_c0_g1_i1.p1  ORF type:complete len:233 (+),score=17.63 TRINITY_DN75611_c0_g1_i1:45-743(+)
MSSATGIRLQATQHSLLRVLFTVIVMPYLWGGVSSTVAAESVMWSARLYKDSACTHPFPKAEDWLRRASPMKVELGECQFGMGKWERYFCGGNGLILETVHNDSQCATKPLFTVNLAYGACGVNPLAPHLYFRTWWTGACGEPVPEKSITSPSLTEPTGSTMASNISIRFHRAVRALGALSLAVAALSFAAFMVFPFFRRFSFFGRGDCSKDAGATARECDARTVEQEYVPL